MTKEAPGAAAGDVVLTLDEVLEVLSGAGSLPAARAALHRKMAGPWLDDWARTQPRDHSGDIGAEAPPTAAPVGIESGDLDDLVHDAASQAASAVNNAGPAAQLAYLTEVYGPAGAAALTGGDHGRPAAGPGNR
jgi:hypothetical protein